MQTPPVTRREIFGWCCYDFANSAFTTIIITVVYSRYFLEVICEGGPEAYAWWGSTLAASQVGVILLAPVLGALADRYARKKVFLALSTILCVGATLLLGTTTHGTLIWAVALVLLANWSFSIGESFCASFLPELSTPENVGRISGYGWSFGYFGGLTSLGLALWIIYTGDTANPDRIRWVFPMTGVFFLLAALPTFIFVRERAQPHTQASKTPLRDEWRAMIATLSEHPRLLLFFTSFLCFMSGVTAVIAFASLYARDVLGFTMTETVAMFIGLQLSSAAGAFSFGFFQDRIGPRQALLTSIVIWVLVCLGAAFVVTKVQFFIVAIAAGFVIGSTQSTSRAIVSLLAPGADSGKVFGFWGSFGKAAAVIGPLSFGWMAGLISPRWAVALLIIFFLLGGWLVIRLGLSSSHDAAGKTE
jgi:UMF1 family MFS transporter